ncbi:hypothetical protein LJR016_003958 [Devosia sp. LjRoot16]|uniref:hypothetical protein n=1 Tax=Devosia sp. LjRoot16 TaxID=3342271 RepID=UPI003ECDF120
MLHTIDQRWLSILPVDTPAPDLHPLLLERPVKAHAELLQHGVRGVGLGQGVGNDGSGAGFEGRGDHRAGGLGGIAASLVLGADLVANLDDTVGVGSADISTIADQPRPVAVEKQVRRPRRRRLGEAGTERLGKLRPGRRQSDAEQRRKRLARLLKGLPVFSCERHQPQSCGYHLVVSHYAPAFLNQVMWPHRYAEKQ